MPRDVGTGLYHYPEGTPGNPGQTVFSARYNTFINDLALTMNTKLPINMGGTGADSALDARDNLDAEVALAVVTDYDTHVWEAGSFKSAVGALAAPTPTENFSGVCHLFDATSCFLEARAYEGTQQRYFRRKYAGEWFPWVNMSDEWVNTTGDTMTGNLTINKLTPTITLNRPSVASSPIQIFGQTNGLNRWRINLGSGAAETGSNVGSDFQINRYSDAGTLIDSPLLISRATGNVTFSGSVTSGNLGVTGTLSATSEVSSASNVVSSEKFVSSTTTAVLGTTGAGSCYLRPNGAASTTNQLSVDSTGRVIVTNGIAEIRAIPGSNAHLYFNTETGTQAVVFYWNRAANWQALLAGSSNFTFAAGGAAAKPGGGNWVDSSDARIKTVKEEYTNGLDEILALRPVVYTYKGNDTFEAPSNARYGEEDTTREAPTVPYANSGHYGVAVAQREFVGLVAQEAETVSPDMVTQISGYIDGAAVDDMRILDTNPLVFKLINAVKTLVARIEALEVTQAP